MQQQEAGQLSSEGCNQLVGCPSADLASKWHCLCLFALTGPAAAAAAAGANADAAAATGRFVGCPSADLEWVLRDRAWRPRQLCMGSVV